MQREMSLKNVRYTRLETEESEGEEDESPPTHVEVNNESPFVKGSRWNHIDNLDEFFERVYEYQQKRGLAAIFLGDVMELVRFIFIVLFTTFLVTCLQVNNLLRDKIKYTNNGTNVERDVIFSDLFDLSGFQRINPVVVLFLLMAFAFWVHMLFRTAVRLYRFWGIRSFYIEALHITPTNLRDVQWSDVVVALKRAQTEHRMNIQKQELNELDVYHRILRFKNYMVAMVNKDIIPCKFVLPFFGEKVFFTDGLKFNYELILFWPSLKAPFKNSFYLREEYKSASKKHQLVKNLRFRITLLAFLNLIFCPAIFLYQLLYSFYSYGELIKNRPSVLGRRRWSLYGRWHLRDFNELEHEFDLRLNRAYKPSVKYMDLFADPLMTILAKNVAFIAGSFFVVLLVMTVLQEDLLTAHNVLTVLTALGVIIAVCRVFIPTENQVWQPAGLMQRILGEIHYMPDHWKQEPHTHKVYREFTHVFQFTLMNVADELLSPLITPFILYFKLRHKASDIIDFLRNFTIDVSGVGDVCSFAEMNVRKHGNPEWLSEGVSRANQYEQAELGKTEISLMHFSRKNPNWKPSEDGATFINQLKQSAEVMHQSFNSSMPSSFHARPHPQDPTHSEPSITYLHPNPQESIMPSMQYPLAPPMWDQSQTMRDHPQACSSDAMQWSIWSVRPDNQYRVLADSGSGFSSSGRGFEGMAGGPMIASTLDTLQIHQIHDMKKVSSEPATNTMNSEPLNSTQLSFSASQTTSSWTFPSIMQASNEQATTVTGYQNRTSELREPLLLPQQPPAAATTEHARGSPDIQDSFHSVENFDRQPSSGYHQFGESTSATTVVELHEHKDQ